MHSYRSASDGLAYAPEALPELLMLPTTGPRFQSNLNPSATDPSWLSVDAVVERQWQDKEEPQHARVFSLHASALSNDSSSQPDTGRQDGLIHHQGQQSFDPGDQNGINSVARPSRVDGCLHDAKLHAKSAYWEEYGLPGLKPSVQNEAFENTSQCLSHLWRAVMCCCLPIDPRDASEL